MKDTYIRPWWHAVLFFIAHWIGLAAIVSLGMFALNPIASSMSEIHNNVFNSTLPAWAIMAIAMSILLCSLLGLLLTTMNYPRTFSREIKKHWVAYNRETGKPLVNLIRKNAKDVVWDEVNVFELTIEKFKNFEDGEPYAIMRDEQQRAFKMSFEHLGKISHLFINGKLHGKFHLVAYSSDQMLYYIEEKS